MRYTLFLYSDESLFADATPEQIAEQQAIYGAYIQSLNEAGVFVDTDWLQPSLTATTVSMADGDRLIQDGPYADTKEQLGGYFVIDVADLDSALDWAARCPAAQMGKVEVRPSAMGQ
ncbi:MAG: YciI family protein [Burkholderiaceae bacterium]